MSKLVCGIGTNDADYPVQKFQTVGYTEEGKRIQKLIWYCPFYRKWVGMIHRSYSQKVQKRQPSYQKCSVVTEWHYFMTFRAWMEKQDWEGKELDKDLLVPGNKIYSPETCIFIDAKVNSFILDCNSARGEWPIGVSFNKISGKFRSYCNEFETGKKKTIGYYDSAEEAHKAWLAFKTEQAYIVAAEQSDPKVAAALIDRYENYLCY